MDIYAEQTNLDVVVDDFDERIGTTTNNFNNLTKGSFVEGLADATGVDGAHNVVRSVS